ncbi:MAG: hypothetical protein PHY93_11680 [Bacteriovorax sp.]|nr:hypothetical protein [Bacteriovorax sp.]
MKKIIFSIVMGLALSSMAVANVPINQTFKNAVVRKFLREANNPKTKLGARIAQINIDTTDGRNNSGTIALPVKAENLQVALLSSEKITNPWHYGSKNDKGDTCTATNNNTDFMILLSSNTAVHMAMEFSTFTFKVNIFENLSAKRKDGATIEDCSEIFLDENRKYYIISPVVLTISDVSEVTITESTKMACP